jgi:hypothetical protein
MTISITILTGEYAGRTAVMPSDINPVELLGKFAKEDIKWEIGYDDATAEEMVDSRRADMVARILAALYHKRSVKFEDMEWKPVSPEQITRAVGEIEDAIVYSGMNFYIERDNEEGVTLVGVHGTRA